MGVIKYISYSGYIVSVFKEDDLLLVKIKIGGMYRRLKNLGDGVERGDVFGEIIYFYEGIVLE